MASVIDKLFALADELEAEIEANDHDSVRSVLVNIRGDLSHLRDVLHAEESMVRP